MTDGSGGDADGEQAATARVAPWWCSSSASRSPTAWSRSTGTWKPELGLDLQGGTRISLTAKGDPSEESLDEARRIIDQRVNGTGVAEAEVTTQGGKPIVVEIPGENREDLVERSSARRSCGSGWSPAATSRPCGAGAQTPQNPLDPEHRARRAEPPEAPQSKQPAARSASTAPPIRRGEPTDKPKQDQTPSGDAVTLRALAQRERAGDDVPGVDDEGFTAPVDEELAWSQAPDPAEVTLFEQFACKDDGTLTMRTAPRRRSHPTRR